MEAALINAIEPGDEVVVCISGFFGKRMLEMIDRAGGRPKVVRAEWGKPVDLSEIRDAMRSGRPRALAIVQAETSTGVLQELEGLASLAHESDALFIVDAVTSLGTHPVAVDRTGIDICFSCSQKGIGAPPGLAPITFSERAIEHVTARRTKVQSWYLDVTAIRRYWGKERAYHHTAPISMNYSLREALRLLCEEGLETRWRRHKLNHRALVAGIEAMGLEMLVEPRHRLWALNTVRVPEGVDDARVRTRLLEESAIEIGGGLGPLKGRIWRVGLMGFGSTRENVLLLLDSLHRTLASEGYACARGTEAAEEVYRYSEPV
jgi:alanine-glyoxylate transaminase/serine-glyoxylate transaminase/serine-pyruvate transaminase